MARIKKKGTAGSAKNYITRTRAVRKLQISLPDFRRLCIFKGIYPREPRNKKKVSKGATSATTFYYTKDIQYLLHEPLIQKFRDHKAVAKKIGRHLGRGEAGDAARLEKNISPKLKLDHIIKERYPTFVDALRDLDDALSMLFLFANLPSHTHIPAKTIALCQRLCLEFQHYVITSHSLRKSFLSIKGIYYQATIQGQDILWLVPYKFVQRVTGDIDFRIMGTFIEFYTTLLGFVNFRLYTSMGLVYPPKFNASSDDRGAELGAFTLEGKTIATRKLEAPTNGQESVKTSAAAQAVADKVAELQGDDNEPIDAADKQLAVAQDDDENKIDTFEPTGADADTLPQPSAENSEIASLFAPFTFYLSRETPRQPLEFLLKAFGCKRVGWDGTLGDGAFTTDENDPNITHQIVDRPALASATVSSAPESKETAAPVSWPRSTVAGRTYVQPQWVWDCINQCKLLRPDIYAPGATLPPHLSPWVKSKKGQYDPTLTLEEQEREGEAEEHEDDMDEDEDEEEQAVKDTSDDNADTKLLLNREDEVEAGEGMDVAGSDEEDEEDEDDEDEEDEADFDGLSDGSASEIDEEEAARIQHQRELEAEAAGLAPESVRAAAPLSNAELARKKRAKKQKADQEELDRQMMMMSRKKRKIMDKMLYSNKKKDEEAEKLRAKRRRIEKGQKKA